MGFRVRIPSRAEAVAPFKSKEAFINFVQVTDKDAAEGRLGTSRWSNKDLDPTAPEERSWTWYVEKNIGPAQFRKENKTHSRTGTICHYTGSPTSLV